MTIINNDNLSPYQAILNSQLSTYEAILDRIQGIAPEAHIAGGAVRDALLGKAIKDIDIFMGHEGKDEVAAMLRSEFKYVKVGEWRQYEMFSDPNVDCVGKFEGADQDIPVCVIGLKEPLSVRDNIGRFDFGICMCAWTGCDPILTHAFQHDVEDHTFTLHRADCAAQFAYSMARYRKLSANRYAGWSLTVPTEFEHLVKDHAFRRHWYFDVDGSILPRMGNVLRPKDR